MHSFNKWLVSICVSVVVLLLQVIVTQQMVISGLKTEMNYAKTASKLSNDQISELMYQVSQLREERTFEDTQQYIAGIVAAIDRRDEYSAIWHDGYSRGTAVQQYAAELDSQKTAAYTESKK